MNHFGFGLKSNHQLVDHLINTHRLKSPHLIDAFLAIDRSLFVPSNLKDYAYLDEALPIGSGQTISQPTTVAIMFELLSAQPGMKVLDIGSGSGWTTGLLASIVGNKGSVIGLERLPELVAFGQRNLSNYHFSQAKIQMASQQLGLPGETFDRILVSAATEILPNELISQLKPEGVLVIPLGHSIWQCIKNNNCEVSKKEYPGYVFVPLIKDVNNKPTL